MEENEDDDDDIRKVVYFVVILLRFIMFTHLNKCSHARTTTTTKKTS